ncbi:MAG: hypothetical protein LBS85_04455 [Clostridiales Family XIII bacterium]|jgi:hypothetical protein|nr:hypothetical protein [Clostridiales Family XIII bacterium]
MRKGVLGIVLVLVIAGAGVLSACSVTDESGTKPFESLSREDIAALAVYIAQLGGNWRAEDSDLIHSVVGELNRLVLEKKIDPPRDLVSETRYSINLQSGVHEVISVYGNEPWIFYHQTWYEIAPETAAELTRLAEMISISDTSVNTDIEMYGDAENREILERTLQTLGTKFELQKIMGKDAVLPELYQFVSDREIQETSADAAIEEAIASIIERESLYWYSSNMGFTVSDEHITAQMDAVL